MSNYKLGSLFDGSGGFPLAGTLCGIEPRWASEVEPYPIAVTRSRFPKMKHLGDISKINGAEIEPVDIITFGSPCQDLSVAGKRAGLKHAANGDEETTRSGLFMEAVRIIKEMRNATNGKYPTFALWENVPGAFSSNKGEDFRIVIEELIKIVEPSAAVPSVPPRGWAYADCYVGDGWSLAYRILDTQYWGVPQRRRRVYLVVDFRGERAREILFEREGLRGYFAQGGTPWKAVAGDAERSVAADDREGNGVIAVDQGGGKSSANFSEELSPTLTRTHGGEPAVAYAEKAICVADHPTPKIDEQGVAYTLTASNYKAPLCAAYLASGKPSVGTLMVNASTKLWLGNQEAFSGDYHIIEGSPPSYIVRRLTPTEYARLQGFPDKWGVVEPKKKLTEDELQFWQDVRSTYDAVNGKQVRDYTEKQILTWYNKLHGDRAEYKMWGNGIALPTALYCMQGISDALNSDDWML